MDQSWGLLHGYEPERGGKNQIHGIVTNRLHTDVGGSQYIIDGKIKLKNDSQIQGFTTNGLKFEDGSEVKTDVVVFCTGFVYLFFFILEFDGFSLLFLKRLSDTREGVRKVCGDEVADKIKPLWGLDEEGEINGCYRDLGFQGLWYIMGEFESWAELNKSFKLIPFG